MARPCGALLRREGVGDDVGLERRSAEVTAYGPWESKLVMLGMRTYGQRPDAEVSRTPGHLDTHGSLVIEPIPLRPPSGGRFCVACDGQQVAHFTAGCN
jgi:hypothetical protein